MKTPRPRELKTAPNLLSVVIHDDRIRACFAGQEVHAVERPVPRRITRCDNRQGGHVGSFCARMFRNHPVQVGTTRQEN